MTLQDSCSSTVPLTFLPYMHNVQAKFNSLLRAMKFLSSEYGKMFAYTGAE